MAIPAEREPRPREQLPKAPDGTFGYLAGLTEEVDLAINNSHFRFWGGAGREWFCEETGGQCTVFSVSERLKGGLYRHMGAHITDDNRIAYSSTMIEVVTKDGRSMTEEAEAPDITEMLQILKRLLEPPKKSRTIIYRIPNKPTA